MAVEISKDEFELLKPYEFELRISRLTPKNIETFVWEVARDRPPLDDYELIDGFYLEVAVC